MDKETITFLSRPENLKKIGNIGMYVQKQKVEPVTWYGLKKYHHYFDNKQIQQVTGNRDNYEAFSREESTRLEWNYSNLMSAITQKRHRDMTTA